jgi:hypothetical protein
MRERLAKALGLSKSGQPYEGVVLRCVEAPQVVPMPGWYGVKADGYIDPKCRVERNRNLQIWVRV